MELARQYCDSQFLSRAIRSLNKAQVHSTVPLPIASALLAQAEGSLKSREKWEKNLRLEWFSWPPGLTLLSCVHVCLNPFKVFVSETIC